MNIMYQIISDPKYLQKYEDMNIYTTNADGAYDLFKSENESFDYNKISPTIKLFITKEDRVKFVRKKQESLNVELRKSLQYDPVEAKRILSSLVSVTLTEPRSGILTSISQLIDTVVNDYLSDTRVVNNLVQISIHDYSTSLHLTNCMLFAIGFGHNQGFSESDIKDLGLIALLHDVGKLEIPDYLLQSARKLTTEEFEIIKNHPLAGEKILTSCKFDKKVIAAAAEHHERLDGTGYPRGIVPELLTSRLIAIIDIFEAITSWRPYKDPIPPLEALKMMKEMADNKQIDLRLFKMFAHSVVGMDNRVRSSGN